VNPSSLPPEAECDRLRPDPRRAARALAQHFILMARAEALADMGERNAAIRSVLTSTRAQQVD
jgi:hypothetical protein